MSELQWLAERFEEHRPRPRAVAYHLLGSLSEADDALQETWLRISRSDTSSVENLEAWLRTVVARVSLNMLRARKAKREQPLEPGLPDPIVSSADGVDPEHEALLADSVGLALLVVLETLTPPERPLPRPTWLASGRSSMRSRPRVETATSRRSWPCWIQTSCSAKTTAHSVRPPRW